MCLLGVKREHCQLQGTKGSSPNSYSLNASIAAASKRHGRITSAVIRRSPPALSGWCREPFRSCQQCRRAAVHLQASWKPSQPHGTHRRLTVRATPHAICPWRRRTGAPEASATGLGPRWVHNRPASNGQQRAGAVTRRPLKPQVLCLQLPDLVRRRPAQWSSSLPAQLPRAPRLLRRRWRATENSPDQYRSWSRHRQAGAGKLSRRVTERQGTG